MIQTAADGSIRINVRVIPRSSRSGLAGIRGDAVLVRVHASPVDGAANAELVAIIAASLGVSARTVSIVAGERSRQKRVMVTGLDATTVMSRLTGHSG